MALQTETLKRAFRYNSVALPDPGPQYTLEQVRDLFAATYPEIVNAAIEGPEEKNQGTRRAPGGGAAARGGRARGAGDHRRPCSW